MHFKQSTKSHWLMSCSAKEIDCVKYWNWLLFFVDFWLVFLSPCFVWSYWHTFWCMHRAHTEQKSILWVKNRHKDEWKEEKISYYLDEFFHIVKNVNFKLFYRLRPESWAPWAALAYASLYLFYSDVLVAAAFAAGASLKRVNSTYGFHSVSAGMHVLRVRLCIVALNSSSLFRQFDSCFLFRLHFNGVCVCVCYFWLFFLQLTSIERV